MHNLETGITQGRDENLSKTDVHSVDQRWPLEKIIVVDVDHLKTSVWSTSTTWKPQSGWRRPLEKLSLVKVDREKCSGINVDMK